MTNYIAEPWNTFTGFLYIVSGIILYSYYKKLSVKHNINISNLLTLLIIFIALGIGTCLFHATLQYKMQLLDEFPMFFLITYAFTTMYARCRNNTNLYTMCLIFATVLCCVPWFTPRSHIIHELARIGMTIVFATCFIYIFYVGATVASQCKDKVCEKLFDRCFFIWIFSIVFWFIDNVFCDLLTTDLAQYIPYLNYHGTAWHLGAGMGIYYFFHVLLCYMIVEQYSMKVNINTFALIFPYITIPTNKKQQ